MIFHTEDGDPYSKLVECYGRLIDSAGDEWKEVCEARMIYGLPLAARGPMMDSIVKKRGRGDKATEHLILVSLQASVKREWQWQKDQREAAK